jgi:hypothetical protein
MMTKVCRELIFRRRETSAGAAPTTAMTHIAIRENLDGKVGFLFFAKASPLL